MGGTNKQKPRPARFTKLENRMKVLYNYIFPSVAVALTLNLIASKGEVSQTLLMITVIALAIMLLLPFYISESLVIISSMAMSLLISRASVGEQSTEFLKHFCVLCTTVIVLKAIDELFLDNRIMSSIRRLYRGGLVNGPAKSKDKSEK